MSQCLVLPRELTIYTVGEMRQSWLSWLSAVCRADAPDNEPCRIDAAAVEEIDAAGLQLLIALLNMAAHDHLELHLLNPSRPIAGACEAMGLQALLAATTPEQAAR